MKNEAARLTWNKRRKNELLLHKHNLQFNTMRKVQFKYVHKKICRIINCVPREREKVLNREGIIKRIHKSKHPGQKYIIWRRRRWLAPHRVYFPGDLQLRRNKWRQISLLELQPKVHAHFCSLSRLGGRRR
jgi:hypothetical protein